ncbi:hypothetical protein J4Q44_G00021920 [Coregonus suidteri]|uniref:Immunoglobulin V-set domain-containing protein n=1 Tax=Coregonus suidteri TaxID=861788 RepID=A0AAN8MGB4_9TELE
MPRSQHMGLHVVSVLFITSVVTTTSLQTREVAAPGSDITLSCSFPLSKNLKLNNVIVNWQHGESEPEVLWGGVMGSNPTMELDSRGRYDVKSELTLRLNSTLTVTAELRLRVLDQSFTKSLTLHPPPVCCVMPAEQEEQIVDVSPATNAAGIGAPVLSRKWSDQETKKDKKNRRII